MSVVAATAGRLVQPGGEVRRFGEGAIAAADAAGGLPARSHQSHDPAPRGLQRLHTGCERRTNTTHSMTTACSGGPYEDE